MVQWAKKVNQKLAKIIFEWLKSPTTWKKKRTFYNPSKQLVTRFNILFMCTDFSVLNFLLQFYILRSF